MKIVAVLFFMIYMEANILAQNYQISFAGTGASTTVDSVLVENLTQCTDTILDGSDTLQLSGTVGTDELNTDADNTIYVYPNPMTGNCTVGFETTAQGKMTIELYEMSGKKILQEQELLSIGHHIYNLSGISNGTYTMKIVSDCYSYTAKIVCVNATESKPIIKHIESIQGIVRQSTVSRTENTGNLKGGRSAIYMQYNNGDRLKLTGFSGGGFHTIVMLVPIQDTSIIFNFVSCTDADSNHYAVVQIGTQIWMAENLKGTHYRNSDTIPNVTNNTQWSNLTTGAYCDYNNISSNSTIYGKLYNWYAVNDSRKIAPVGWHIPTDAEWTILEDYLVDWNVAGGKLKEACSILWCSPNIGASNESGFTALPGGERNNNGVYGSLSFFGNWWSTTYENSTNAWYMGLGCDYNSMWQNYFLKKYGYSVRCVRD